MLSVHHGVHLNHGSGTSDPLDTVLHNEITELVDRIATQ